MTVFGDLEIVHADRAAGRPGADPDQRRAAGRPADLDRPGLAAGARGGREGPPGLRRVPADHRRRARAGRAGPGRLRRGRTADPRRPRAPRGWRRSRRSSTSSPTDRSPGCGSAQLHGRLPADEKDAHDARLRRRRHRRAGATTVIEVGVDVANATAMVLLDADRFGVSQLHQLRGRVGRGGLPASACWSRHAAPASAGVPASGSTRSRAPPTASSSAGSTSSSAARATCSGARSPGVRSQLENLRVLRDEETIVAGAGRGGVAARRRSGPRSTPHFWPQRWRTWSSRGSLTSWRSRDVVGARLHDPDHRGVRGRPPDQHAPRRRHPSHQRPGARGALLRHRVLVRIAPGLRFLDLYAGSGAVGLEAWSRGAGVVTLVEQDRRTAVADRRQRQGAGLRQGRRAGRPPSPAPCTTPPPRRTTSRSSTRRTPSTTRAVDADLAALVDNGWLVPGALVVVERSARSAEPTWPDGSRADPVKALRRDRALVRSRAPTRPRTSRGAS